MDRCAHCITLAEHANPLCSINQLAPERAAGLKAGENNVGILLPDAMLEMVADTAAITHPCSGNDDRPVIKLVQGNRLFCRCCQ